MKKLLAILLSTIMVISCFSITASAESTKAVVSDNQEFVDNLNNYLINLGLGEYYFDVDTTADGYVEGDSSTYTYTNLFTTETIKTTDKIVIYEENENEIMFQIVGSVKEYTTEKIEDFLFTSDTFFHESNPCGYFRGFGYSNCFYGIADEVKEYGRYIEKFSRIFPCINQKPEDVQKAEALVEAKYGYATTLENVGMIGELSFYYKKIYYGEAVIEDVYYQYVGDYAFRVHGGNYKTFLYVVAGDEAYMLEDAYSAGLITDLDAVYDMLTNSGRNFFFKMEKMNDELYHIVEYLKAQGVEVNGKASVIPYYNLGEVDSYTVCLCGETTNGIENTSALGDYIFTYSDYKNNKPYGFWLVNGDKVYPLSDAYNNGIINGSQLAEICALLMAENGKYGWQIEKSSATSEKLIENTCGQGDYNLMQIEDFGDYKVYYNVTKNTTVADYEKEVGDYRFTLTAQQTPYDLGLYVVSDSTAYTLNNAWNNGVITPEQMLTLFKTIKSSRADFDFTLIRFQFTDGTGMANNETKLTEVAESLVAEKYGYTPELKRLGTVGNCTYYYRIVEAEIDILRGKYLGDYFITYGSSIGLYVIADSTAYTIEDAVDAGVVANMDAVCDMLENCGTDLSFTMEKVVTKDCGTLATIKAGERIRLLPVSENSAYSRVCHSSNTKIAQVDINGYVTGLKKGTVTIKIGSGSKLFTGKVKVTTNPKLSKSKVTVKKNKTAKVRINGKAGDIKNVYTNKKIAKIISGRNATTLKVKGLKKGTTTLKIKVNGVKTLKLKVVVK